MTLQLTYREGVAFIRDLQDIYSRKELLRILTEDFGWTRQRAITTMREALGKV